MTSLHRIPKLSSAAITSSTFPHERRRAPPRLTLASPWRTTLKSSPHLHFAFAGFASSPRSSSALWPRHSPPRPLDRRRATPSSRGFGSPPPSLCPLHLRPRDLGGKVARGREHLLGPSWLQDQLHRRRRIASNHDRRAPSSRRPEEKERGRLAENPLHLSIFTRSALNTIH